MKKMRKIFAVLLTLAMVLAMSIPTFAAGTGGTTTITVKHAQDATLNYAQVVVADQTNSVTGWKFVEGYANVFRTAFGVGTDDDAILKLIALGKLEVNPNSNAAAGNINTGVVDNAKLGEQLATALANITLSGEGTKATSDSFELTKEATAGLYVITASKAGHTYNPMMAYVAFDKNATDGSLLATVVEAKGSEDQIRKQIVEVDGSDQNDSVMTGDVIPYKVTVSYPYYPANATDKKFEVTDTVENATFNKDSVSVTVAGSKLDSSKYSIAFAPEDKATTMTISFVYDSTLAGKQVVINYSATVGDIKDGQQVKNGAKSESNGKYTIAEVISGSAKFTLVKVDTTDKKNKKYLEGAEFTLYVKADDGDVTFDDVDGKFKSADVETTDSDGKLTFKGLDVDKTYYVVETKAPAGYSIDKTPRLLTGATKNTTSDTTTVKEKGIDITKVTTTTTVTDYTNNNVEIPNTKLNALPSTGGIGTTIFTIAGCLIMVAAAGLFFASRKRTNK